MENKIQIDRNVKVGTRVFTEEDLVVIKQMASKIGVQFQVLLGCASVIDFEGEVKDPRSGFLKFFHDAVNGSQDATLKILHLLVIHVDKVDRQSIPMDNELIVDVINFKHYAERPEAFISRTLIEELKKVQITESEYTRRVNNGAYKKKGSDAKEKTLNVEKKNLNGLMDTIKMNIRKFKEGVINHHVHRDYFKKVQELNEQQRRTDNYNRINKDYVIDVTKKQSERENALKSLGKEYMNAEDRRIKELKIHSRYEEDVIDLNLRYNKLLETANSEIPNQIEARAKVVKKNKPKLQQGLSSQKLLTLEPPIKKDKKKALTSFDQQFGQLSIESSKSKTNIIANYKNEDKLAEKYGEELVDEERSDEEEGTEYDNDFLDDGVDSDSEEDVDMDD